MSAAISSRSRPVSSRPCPSAGMTPATWPTSSAGPSSTSRPSS
jgi:hypothetical protein